MNCRNLIERLRRVHAASASTARAAVCEVGLPFFHLVTKTKKENVARPGLTLGGL